MEESARAGSGRFSRTGVERDELTCGQLADTTAPPQPPTFEDLISALPNTTLNTLPFVTVIHNVEAQLRHNSRALNKPCKGAKG